MLEIRHLKTLSALREHGSLVAAANDLCLTPSAISHQLKELDHWYGVEVVNRGKSPCDSFQCRTAFIETGG